IIVYLRARCQHDDRWSNIPFRTKLPQERSIVHRWDTEIQKNQCRGIARLNGMICPYQCSWSITDSRSTISCQFKRPAKHLLDTWSIVDDQNVSRILWVGHFLVIIHSSIYTIACTILPSD